MVNIVSAKSNSTLTPLGWLAIVISLLCVPSWTQAQDEEPPETKLPENSAPPDILKDGTLDVTARVYMLDGRNKPVFVPNLTYEQYLESASAAARRAEGGDAPNYKIDEFVVDARVEGKVASVQNRIKITLNELAGKFTDIPLRMQSCLLTEPPKFEGPGRSQLDVGRNAQPGYIWSLQAESNTTHSATLTGQTAVRSDNDRQTILFTLPAALSTVHLNLPPNAQDIDVRGQGGEVTSDEPVAGGKRITIKSQGGDIAVSWRVGSDAKPSAAAVEAISKTRLRVDDPREPWIVESTISLDSEVRMETLVVELPEGSQGLANDNPADDQYTIIVDENNPRRLTLRATARGNLVGAENMQIRYRWKAPDKAVETNWNNIVVPSITIRGVDRHEGALTMIVPASLGLDWKSPPGVALVGQTSIREIQESVQYVFQFVRQPLGLTVSFRREVNLAEVRPTYLIEVDRSGIKLTGWLQCAFDRGQKPELGIDLADWELDSAQLIADMSNPLAEGELLTQQVMEEGSQRILRLRSQLDPELTGVAREQQVWRFTAFRSHVRPAADQTAADRVALPVPLIWLVATDQTRVPLEHASGVLLVGASDSVLLDFDSQNSRSLLTDALAAPWQTLLSHLPIDQVLSYRFQAGSGDKPVWAGRIEILPRRIAAEQTVQMKLDVESVMVHQRFQLQIANEPLGQLRLATGGAKNVSVLVDGIPWVLEAETNTSANAPPPSPTAITELLTAKGSRKLIGKVVIDVHSHQALPEIPVSQVAQSDSRWTDEAVSVQVPLVSLAVDDLLVRSPVAVLPTIDRRLQVSKGSRESLWSADGSTDNGTSQANWSTLEEAGFEIPASQLAIPLKLVQLEGADPLPVRVTEAWIQTVVSGNTRADRFCARFKTAQEAIRLRLPANDMLAQVAIDGEQVFSAPREGQLQINLRGLNPQESHTLEVWTRSPTTPGWVNRIEVAPIEIQGCARFDHFYWQLITNPNMHLALIPDTLTPEWTWVWDRLWWQRHSPIDQVDLEQWLSASSQRPVSLAANKYVLSSYGTVAGFQVWTVSRLLLWLPVGLIAIGGALLVSLFRSFRHPAALLLLIACVLSMATVWPDLAILIGQTSLFALLIVVLYGLLQAAVESRVRRRSVFTSRPTSGTFDASDNQSLVRPPSVGESDVMPTTRTQSPVVADGGGS